MTALVVAYLSAWAFGYVLGFKLKMIRITLAAA